MFPLECPTEPLMDATSTPIGLFNLILVSHETSVEGQVSFLVGHRISSPYPYTFAWVARRIRIDLDPMLFGNFLRIYTSDWLPDKFNYMSNFFLCSTFPISFTHRFPL